MPSFKCFKTIQFDGSQRTQYAIWGLIALIVCCCACKNATGTTTNEKAIVKSKISKIGSQFSVNFARKNKV